MTSDEAREAMRKMAGNVRMTLPCKIGDILYTNVSVQGWYMRRKDRPYKVRVVFIGINGTDNFINVSYENGYTWGFNFSEIGKRIFYTKEEAERALKY